MLYLRRFCLREGVCVDLWWRFNLIFVKLAQERAVGVGRAGKLSFVFISSAQVNAVGVIIDEAFCFISSI